MDRSIEAYVKRLTDEQLAEFLRSYREKGSIGEDPRVVNAVMNEQMRRKTDICLVTPVNKQ